MAWGCLLSLFLKPPGELMYGGGILKLLERRVGRQITKDVMGSGPTMPDEAMAIACPNPSLGVPWTPWTPLNKKKSHWEF